VLRRTFLRCSGTAAVAALAWPAGAQEAPPPEVAAPAAPAIAPPPAGMVATLFTPTEARIPRDAHLVVGLVEAPGSTPFPTGVLLRRNQRRTQAVNVQVIAPGLYRLIPEGLAYGRYTLEGVRSEPRLVFARARIPGPPPVPRVTTVERYFAVHGTDTVTELRATFTNPIPDTVVAVIMAFDDDSPDHFVRAVPTARELVLFQSGHPMPEGASAPSESGTVRVAFVDRVGQVSEMSSPRTF
jgi:hypothetical protein